MYNSLIMKNRLKFLLCFKSALTFALIGILFGIPTIISDSEADTGYTGAYYIPFVSSAFYESDYGSSYSSHNYNNISIAVPILMYHHLAEHADSPWTVTPESFEQQMRWLVQNGFNTVSLRQLYNFVNHGVLLPENPVVITFDDGYLSVYEQAFPILKRYGLSATVFVIGSQVGTSYYKDTGHPTTPKFCFDQAAAMVQTGLVEIQSHTYDMHQWAPFEIGPARENILIMYGERIREYLRVLIDDNRLISNLIYDATGQHVFAVAFPFGVYDELSMSILKKLGISITLTVSPGMNQIEMDYPLSLQLLRRNNVTDNLDENAFLRLLQS